LLNQPSQALANIREALKPDGIFVMNYFDIDSLPGKILGNHHFEYNHASLVIFSRRTMRQCQAARIARIQAASTGGICPCLRRVAGCATPTGGPMPRARL